ncbi:family 16 glycosylhydrolase [Gracilimonas sp. Q87]|uniref:glycoside hydrolase family 16 protein n=1 Tax=Gracilimonas sp. Q87 TaxID=3384766 RepID=UPI00398422BA
MSLLALTLFLLVNLTNCSTDNTVDSFDYNETDPTDTLQAGELIWSDEFSDNGTPNSNNWTYDIGHGEWGWGNNEEQYYTDDPENVRVENGNLIITALKENGEWTSARIKTKGLKEFKYVTVKARAKLPEGIGTWPAIWMLGSDIDTEGWPESGEIDIMEHVGKDPGIVHSSLHTPSSHGNTQNSDHITVPDYNSEFHVYELVWTPESMTFKVDGETFYIYSPSSKTAETWPFNNDFFIILNVAMGGNWGSDPQYETGDNRNGIHPDLTEANMIVDYVRVYKN